MVFIVKFMIGWSMIGWSMLLLLLAGIAARKMKDDPTKFWRDQNDDTSDDNDDDNNDETDT
ncbi:MAG: hypothetical protein V3U54_07795 [Thermodesulfobacteriota bacterium]